MSHTPAIAATPTPVSQPPSALRKGLDIVYLVAAVLGAVCVALICVLMVFQSLGREFGMNTGATNDIVSWLCAAAAFFTMAHAFKHGDFVRVTPRARACGSKSAARTRAY